MARTRNIKPSLFANEVLGLDSVDPLLTILFEALWCLADREGRLEDRPVKIKGFAFPYRSIDNPDAMLQWLADKGFIDRYQTVEKRYIQIVNFAENQNVHPHEARSAIPSKPINTDVTECHGHAGRSSVVTPLPSFPSLPSSSSCKNDETPHPAQASVTGDPWKGWLELLQTDVHMTEAQARRFLGRLAKDFGKDLVTSSLADAHTAVATEQPADPRSFLIGVIRQRDKSKAAAYVGKGKPLRDCKTCGNDRFINAEWMPNKIAPCPDCCAKDHEFCVDHYKVVVRRGKPAPAKGATETRPSSKRLMPEY